MRTIAIEDLNPDPDNANRGREAGAELIAESIGKNGAGRSVLLDSADTLIAGNKTWEAAKRAGIRRVVVVETDGDELIAVKRRNVALNSPQGREMALSDNGLGAFNLDFDLEVVARQAAEHGLDLDAAGLDANTMAAFQAAALDAGAETSDEAGADTNTNRTDTDTRNPRSLAERFGAPPFDVFDSRQGYWQERKRQWLDWGLRSAAGREDAGGTWATSGAGAVKDHAPADAAGGVSIYDPVLCELFYRWYMQPPQHVLDPCAGGSVRGLVAHRCGMTYVGIEPRRVQIQTNRAQAESLIPDDHPLPAPVYMEGYAQDLLRAPDLFGEADLIHTCPPFHDLERYSDDPRDLSAMTWENFAATLDEIIGLALAILRPNRFSIWVVGDIRDGDGRCRNFPGMVAEAHARHGATLYQDAVFLTPLGSLPIRAGHAFKQSRKLGRCHQRILVFYKGDVRLIREHFPADIPVAPDADTSEIAVESPG